MSHRSPQGTRVPGRAHRARSTHTRAHTHTGRGHTHTHTPGTVVPRGGPIVRPLPQPGEGGWEREAHPALPARALTCGLRKEQRVSAGPPHSIRAPAGRTHVRTSGPHRSRARSRCRPVWWGARWRQLVGPGRGVCGREQDPRDLPAPRPQPPGRAHTPFLQLRMWRPEASEDAEANRAKLRLVARRFFSLPCVGSLPHCLAREPEKAAFQGLR